MNYKKDTQTRGCMKSVMRYVSQLSKTLWDGQQLVSGIGCQPETAFDEFLSTKLLHHKDGGVQFYHMVQSFPKGAAVDPRQAHEAARRLAVDAADERHALPCGFLFLHDVEHHAAHGGAGLCAPLVVHKMYDGHTAHRPSMTARNAALTSDSSPAAFS